MYLVNTVRDVNLSCTVATGMRCLNKQFLCKPVTSQSAIDRLTRLDLTGLGHVMLDFKNCSIFPIIFQMTFEVCKQPTLKRAPVIFLLISANHSLADL